MQDIAVWNTGRRVWEHGPALVCGHRAPYAVTWPPAGTMRAGTARHRAPAGRPPGLGPLLPTPRVSDSNGPGERKQGGPDLRTVIARVADATPAAPAYWGMYAPALDQWERLAGPVPAPTAPGRHP